jgi:hypothetical protein
MATTKPVTKVKPNSRAWSSADPAKRLTAAQFREWQGARSNAATARLLYVSENTLAQYREEGAPPGIARQCWAIDAGIEPDTGPERARLLGRINAALDAEDAE